MNGESVNHTVEAAFAALRNQVELHLQTGLPRLLNYLWQPLVPFLMVPTPAIALIAVNPEKPYCQKEALAAQTITMTPFTDNAVPAVTKPCYFQFPHPMTLYPLQCIEQKKQCEHNHTRLTVTLKNTNAQRPLLLDQGLQVAVAGSTEFSIAFWQQLCQCTQVSAAVQQGSTRCLVESIAHQTHAFQDFLPPLLHYALAPETLLLIKIQFKAPLTVLAGEQLQLLFEWPDILDNQQLPTEKIRLILNSTWIFNCYETDAIPIREPKTRDTHWIQPLQKEVLQSDILSVASLHGMTAHHKQNITASLTTYPKSTECPASYFAFYEEHRLGLQLAGDLSEMDWLSLSVWAHQGDRPFDTYVPGKVAGDLDENPLGWQWELITRCTPAQRNRQLPDQYTDLSWLSAPLQLFQTETILREYLALFTIKAPSLLKKIAAIEQIRYEKNQVFSQGMFQLQCIVHWHMDVRAFESVWDCQLFLQAVYWQVLPLVPYAYQLQFQLTTATTRHHWHWPILKAI